MDSFEQLSLSDFLARSLKDLGYAKPTAIQAQTLPILLSGRCDFIGQAATGTGKTAAFGIPLLEQADAAQKHVQGIILCPTRELALQVAGQIKLLGKHKGIKALAIYGGADYAVQIDGLRRGAQVVVGTPGRIIDHIQRGSLSLERVLTVVLDEADEMISMGFKEELEKILKAVPRERSHIWLFSATMSKEVRRVAATYLKNPKQVAVNRDEMLSTTVEQLYITCQEAEKPSIVCRLIDAADDFYGLIFCQTKALVTEVNQYLLDRGYKTDCLHGDKSQADRERTMKSFREKRLNLLVCTDVASRGLDVKELTHVINYSIPRELDAYVHRIGRTARSGKAGVAVSLVTPFNRGLISRIEHMTKSAMRETKAPGLHQVRLKKAAKLLAALLAQAHHEKAAALLGTEWDEALRGMDRKELVARFVSMLAPELFEAPASLPPPPPRAHVPTQAGHRPHRYPPKKPQHWKKKN
ncbi:MAG: DEAD/DEAH box helicase [Elusimicrobia bacterium]|nr:DEAD/DEAH box helicase [Elusimicrobiota bacterium]